jgi:hypothetical protein
VELAQAVEILSGSIRVIDGLAPDHFEVGPGQSVPGAEPDLPIVRTVYRGGRLLLDQQRLAEPTQSDTLQGTSAEGVSVARWTSGDAWLSLAGRLPLDSLSAIMRRVR